MNFILVSFMSTLCLNLALGSYQAHKYPEVHSIIISSKSNGSFPMFPELPGFSNNFSSVPEPDFIGLTPEQIKFAKDSLKAHNRFREHHNTPPLKLDTQLILNSQKWAIKVAADCDESNRFILKHSNEPDIGENIYAVRGPDHFERWKGSNATHTRGYEAVAAWYSEVNNYKYETPGYQWKAGHFTQMIWKDTTTMGIAWTLGTNGTIVVVGQYKPYGNIMDDPMEFELNVLPPKNNKYARKKKVKTDDSEDR